MRSTLTNIREVAPIVFTGWLPGYADPEYFLRLLFQSDSKTNEGGFSYPPFDELIERARRERSDRSRLELFHEADRMVVADRVALIPLVYGLQHGVREAVGPRVVGVREVVVGVRQLGCRPVLAARLTRQSATSTTRAGPPSPSRSLSGRHQSV